MLNIGNSRVSGHLEVIYSPSKIEGVPFREGAYDQAFHTPQSLCDSSPILGEQLIAISSAALSLAYLPLREALQVPQHLLSDDGS